MIIYNIKNNVGGYSKKSRGVWEKWGQKILWGFSLIFLLGVIGLWGLVFKTINEQQHETFIFILGEYGRGETVVSGLPSGLRSGSQGVSVDTTIPGQTEGDRTIKIQDVVYRVYRLESSGGRNDSCRNRGLFNGYGYIPGQCYASHEEVTGLVTAWFEREIPKKGLVGALCYYNTGRVLETCDYYKNYLKL